VNYEVFKVEKKEGGIAIMTFNRPEKFNAASIQLFEELESLVQELDGDKEIGCIILTGQTITHPKKGTPFPVFSAGADITEFENLGTPEVGYDFIKICFRPFKAIELCETPIIAAVNGVAFGFGFEIAGACDMAFAARDARFALKEIIHGAIPAWTITRGLEKYDKNLVAYLCLSARELSAEEASRFGVVIDVFESDELLPRCEEIARDIAQHGFLTKTYIKKILNQNTIPDFETAERYMPAIYATEWHLGASKRFEDRKKK
jgi:enoyl-CoA hydratase/carnithine racemase